eukprot:2788622-Pleurochrysis_carterae.AAC.2
MKEGISVDIVGTQGGTQGGVAIEEAREMLPHEELLSRGGLLRPDHCERQPLIRQAEYVVRHRIEPMARLPLGDGEVGGGGGEQERGVDRTI